MVMPVLKNDFPPKIPKKTVKKKDLKYTMALKSNWLITVELKVLCRQKYREETKEEMDFSFEYMQYAADLDGERTIEIANQIAAEFFPNPMEYYIKSITLKNHD